MKSKYIYIFIVISFSFNWLNSNDNKKLYSFFFSERLNYITNKEYSSDISSVYVGLVNYPQWFVTLSTGMYRGLTMQNTIKGSESLYPTNVTQDRWMHTFNTSSRADIELCKMLIMNWTDIPNLELVMYSQAMIVCLSSNMSIMENDQWYEHCWRKYHSNCRISKDDKWI